jgi:cytochrome c biogenesis protein
MSRSDIAEAQDFGRRPEGHADAPEPPRIQQPRLGPVGWLRFLWRQLTSMRTALLLLLLLALAAVPGSLVPQRTSDPNGVTQYMQQHPEAYKVLDSLGVFSTFASPWFSAIYLLLFVSLVGCIIPRTRHHLQALLAKPPRTPMRLQRLIGYRESASDADVETAVEAGRRVLRRMGYRVERYGDSVSAERGYLRETGNLIFHVALVGILLTIGVFGSFGYTGQKILVQDGVFTNVGSDYDSFIPGRFASVDDLRPFQMRLDSFTPTYSFNGTTGRWDPQDYDTKLSTRLPGDPDWTSQTLKVNSPVSIGGTEVYLLGNGYAPVLTIRDANGTVVKNEPTPFLAQDANLTSTGVIKVADGLTASDGKPTQVGIQAFFRPTPGTGAGDVSSLAPQLSKDADVFLSVYTGDLGLDGGTPQNVYTLDVSKLQLVAGRDHTGQKVGGGPIDLTKGQTAQLPDGLGTVTLSGITRYVSLDIHHDPTPTPALIFALLVLGGLLLSLFVPRRRIWITASAGAAGTELRYAGLARGEDANLERAVEEVAERHRAALGDEPPADPPSDLPDDSGNPEPRM